MKMRKLTFTTAAVMAAMALSATTAIASTASYTYKATSAVGSVQGTITVDVAKTQICYTITSGQVKNLKSIELWAAGQKTMSLKVSKIGSTKPTCLKLSDPEAPTDVTGSPKTAYVKFTNMAGKTLKAYLK